MSKKTKFDNDEHFITLDLINKNFEKINEEVYYLLKKKKKLYKLIGKNQEQNYNLNEVVLHISDYMRKKYK